jgi:hypothetical protein
VFPVTHELSLSAPVRQASSPRVNRHEDMHRYRFFLPLIGLCLGTVVSAQAERQAKVVATEVPRKLQSLDNLLARHENCHHLRFVGT